MKPKLKFRRSRGDDLPRRCASTAGTHSEKPESGKRKSEICQGLLTSSSTDHPANSPISRSGFREKAAFSKEIKTAALYREAATTIANGRLACFSGQKKPKLASDIVMSDLDKGFSESDKGLSELDKGFWKTDKGLLEPEKGFSKSDKGLSELNKGFWKLEKGFSKSDKGFSRPDKGLLKPDKSFSKSDKGFSNADKGMSEADFVRKMFKNRQFARKRQKMGQPCKFYADFYKTGVAASRQRAASMVSLRNAAVCRPAATMSEDDEAHSEKSEIGNRKSEIGNESENVVSYCSAVDANSPHRWKTKNGERSPSRLLFLASRRKPCLGIFPRRNFKKPVGRRFGQCPDLVAAVLPHRRASRQRRTHQIQIRTRFGRDARTRTRDACAPRNFGTAAMELFPGDSMR